MSSFPPQAFMIGAQKSGTTYLAALLDQSPDICISDPKEPHFLTHDFERGMEYYASLFKKPGAKICLDASTTYTFLRPKDQMDAGPDAPGLLDPVPQRIHDLRPDAKLIYLLRDPVERAISALQHNLRVTKDGGAPPSLLDTLKADPQVELASRYSAQIARYQEVFGPEAFLFLSFDELRRDPQTVADKCFAFFDVDPVTLSLEKAEGQKHKAYTLSKTAKVIRRARMAAPGLITTLKRLPPAWVKDRVRDKLYVPTKAAAFEDRGAVEALFADEKTKIAEMTGITFDAHGT